MAKKVSNYSQLISNQLIELLTNIPEPTVSAQADLDEIRMQRMIRNTSLQTSSISAALSIPGGITGLVTVLPEVVAIWRLQSQLVSNIASMYGQSHIVTKEQMLWCMFRQMGFGLFKEFVIQQGGVYLVKQMSDKAFTAALRKLSHGLLTRQGTRVAGRVIPVIGSVSAGALSYYDTFRVGKNAKKLYHKPIEILPANNYGDDYKQIE